MFEIWLLHRRSVLIGAGLVAAITAVVVVLMLVLRSSPASTATPSSPAGSGTSPPSSSTPAPPTAPASDVRSWDAIKPVTASVSKGYPAIGAAAARDPDSFARAFAVELFTRNYTNETRARLLAWAQYEDAPLESPNYPRADWSKVLVDSLTDLTWDNAASTPVPADGLWLALQAERATQAVRDVKIALDPQWEQKIAAGYQPPDRLATVRDVTLTVSQRTTVAGRPSTTAYDVSLSLQLGTSPRGGYGVAATDNYVIKKAD
jgi:hypothetical protein